MSTSLQIESNDLTIDKILKDFYQVPDFQREFVWTNENVEVMLQDIWDEMLAGDEQQERSEYFLGSIVVCLGADGVYDLIDGQQRITTIFLTLCAARDLLEEQRECPDWLRDSLRDTAPDMETGDDIERFRLVLQYEDSDKILERVAAGNTAVSQLPGRTSSARRLLGAYDTAQEFLRSNLHEDPDRIKQFLGRFVNRVKLIRINTPTIANALKVFETINDRGVGLNAMDLLKNFLFIKASDSQHAQLKNEWKHLVDTLDRCGEKPMRFLRYYIMAQHVLDAARGLREDEIYSWFRNNSQAMGIDDEPISFVQKLTESAHNYANFLASRDAYGNHSASLRNLRLLGGAALRQHHILFMAGQHLPEDAFDALVRAVENLMFCYIITGEPARNFERSFTRWSNELRKARRLKDIECFIGNRITPETVERKQRFIQALRDLSEDKIQKYRMKYILAKITQHVEGLAWDKGASSELDHYMSADIEHILPLKPQAELQSEFDLPDLYDDYARRLGNLTLLQDTLNRSIANKSYEVKKSAYEQEPFLLTRSLVQRPQVGTDTRINRAGEHLVQFCEWNSDSISKRQEMLIRLALGTWGLE